MLRRKLAVLGAAVTMVVMLVMAAAAVSAQPAATTETRSFSSPESFTVDNPCPGYEEPILVQGVFHHVMRVTKVDRPNTPPGTDIYSYLSHTNTTDVTGTGEVSGDVYRFINPGSSTGGSFSTAATPKGQGVAASFIDEGNEQMVSEGASPNFTLHETTKYTLLSDGTATAVVENTWTTCTGGV